MPRSKNYTSNCGDSMSLNIRGHGVARILSLEIGVYRSFTLITKFSGDLAIIAIPC